MVVLNEAALEPVAPTLPTLQRLPLGDATLTPRTENPAASRLSGPPLPVSKDDFATGKNASAFSATGPIQRIEHLSLLNFNSDHS